jgi:hypothetical protein
MSKTEQARPRVSIGVENANREIGRQDYEAQTAEALARIQFQIDYSKNLLNGLMVVNGGSIISLLTYIGNTGSKVDPGRMTSAFAFYSAGLALVFVAYIGAFFSQLFMYNAAQFMAWNAQARALDKPAQYDVNAEGLKGNIAIGVGVIPCLFSLAGFIAGSIAALNALT